MILHTDGSSIGNTGPSGFGAVLRNHEGVWIEGISGNLGNADNSLAEVVAILEGLNLAVARRFTTLTCYSDSQEALRLIQRASVVNQKIPLPISWLGEEPRKKRSLRLGLFP
ncbi:Polynucleotidyl transferase- ribonuclease H-like superfamily protein [Striga hermonthica]|uniref:Polynucleotidyl transferase- ribonuclease H-like superfamily protein n=1 Tax=Striga hermonthica TaxID=68872 RepID=A0A9N7MXF6_STRHE|nr:Polynucleotidyl transferase- ribonuclease H-like superfamily protein [Striga hermonthica]